MPDKSIGYSSMPTFPGNDSFILVEWKFNIITHNDSQWWYY